jgi:hypothetical protein
MEHEYKTKELEKNHEIQMKKGEEYRKNIILFGFFGMGAMLLLLGFAWLMAYIGLKDTIFPTLQSLVSLFAVGFGAFHYAKKKNNS